MKTWTHQQQAIFDWMAKPTARRNLVVRARAGTGKTTTIVEALEHAPETRTLLAAFNAKIRDELARRAPPGVTVKTLHQHGLAAVNAAWGRVTVDGDRGKAIAGGLLQPHMPVGFVYANSPNTGMRRSPEALGFTTISGLIAKLAGVGKRTLCDDAAELARVAWSYDAEPSEEWQDRGWTTMRVARLAVDAMHAAAERTSVIDFDDMLWIPHAAHLCPARFELVVIDEAQDMNAAQLALAMASVTPGGRVVVVGDDRQAIYGFMGAASGALDRTREVLNATELRLSVTFRCPRKVVAAACVYVPDYEAPASAQVGVADEVTLAAALPRIQAGDFVLSRTNAGAVGACLALLRLGTRATVLGRDVGANIKARVKGFNTNSIEGVIRAAIDWAANERAQADAADRPQRADRAADLCETILVLAEGLTTVQALLDRIEGLFDESAQGRVACSTVHKSKGLEAHNVWILADTFRNSDSIEEENLRYVAMTRALAELHFIGEGPFGPAVAASMKVAA